MCLQAFILSPAPRGLPLSIIHRRLLTADSFHYCPCPLLESDARRRLHQLVQYSAAHLPAEQQELLFTKALFTAIKFKHRGADHQPQTDPQLEMSSFMRPPIPAPRTSLRRQTVSFAPTYEYIYEAPLTKWQKFKNIFKS